MVTGSKTLKQSCSPPLLHSPDFTRPFFIKCYASQFGVGAVLAQKSEIGKEVPIAYISHRLNSTQRNYSVLKQEYLQPFWLLQIS